MKSYFLMFISMALLGNLPVYSQSQISSDKFMFGVKGGLNVSNLVQKDNSMDLITGFYFAGVVEFKISESFAIEPEFGYSGQGADVDDYSPELNTTMKGRFRLNYFNVPIMAKYYFGNGFSAEAGPQISFLSSAKFVGDINQSGIVTHIDDDVEDDFESMDFGANVGIGYSTKLGGFAGIRFNLGFTDTFKDNPDDAITNAVLQFYIGYRL